MRQTFSPNEAMDSDHKPIFGCMNKSESPERRDIVDLIAYLLFAWNRQPVINKHTALSSYDPLSVISLVNQKERIYTKTR